MPAWILKWLIDALFRKELDLGRLVGTETHSRFTIEAFCRNKIIPNDSQLFAELSMNISQEVFFWAIISLVNWNLPETYFNWCCLCKQL